MKRSVFKIILMLVLFLGISYNVNAEDIAGCWTKSENVVQTISSDGEIVTFGGKGTIDITKDFEAFIIIEESADLVINLNGKTIATPTHKNDNVTSYAEYDLLQNYGKLTINGDGKMIHQVDIHPTGHWVIKNYVGAKLELNGGTYTRKRVGSTGGNSGYIIKNLGEANMSGNIVMNPGNTLEDASLINNGWNSGDFLRSSEKGYDRTKGVTKLVINSGSYVGGKRAVTTDLDSTTIINGGTYNNFVRETVKSAGNTIINGGEFVSPAGINTLVVEDDGSFEVVNGDFSSDVSSYMNLDSESIKNEDGTYTVNFVYADYSKIDEIIEKVIDEGVDTYTKESIAALEKELEKVDWELGKSKQSDVDKMADAVTKVYKQLKKIENPATNSNAEIIVSIILLVLMFVGIRLSMKKRENNA